MVEGGKGGSIVMISSIAGMKALEKRTVYCSSKGALDQLTRCLALELGPHKVMRNRKVKWNLPTRETEKTCTYRIAIPENASAAVREIA